MIAECIPVSDDDDGYHGTAWPCPLCRPECYDGRVLKREFDPDAERFSDPAVQRAARGLAQQFGEPLGWYDWVWVASIALRAAEETTA